MSDVAISCKKVTKIYPMYNNSKDRFKEALHPFRKTYHKEFFALNDVSFEVNKGETIGIIGHNGAGKSTLLKIITGVLTPTSGEIKVDGIVSSILELGTGFNPELTGIENIYVNCSLMGLSKSQTDRNLERIINFADIGDHISQPVRGYSSGMFARLAMAVAISIDPDILIVDEALAVGDINFQAKCMTAMKRIQSRGTTILFVSHDINSVKSLCEKCIYLKGGAIHSFGKAGDIAELYMKEMRELQHSKLIGIETAECTNNEQARFKTRIENSFSKDTKTTSLFKVSSEFDSSVSDFRYGTGGAKITYVELLDIHGNLINEVEFNQEVKLRIYLESNIEKEVSINFQIFDDKKINVVSGGCLLAGTELLKINIGSKYIVDYQFKLPIQSNNYSIQTTITSTIVENVSYEFIDAVPNSYLFHVKVMPNITLWSKVHVFPQLTITKV